MKRSASGSPRASPRGRTRSSAGAARRIRRRRPSRSRARRTGISRCSTQEGRVESHPHLLPHASPQLRLRRGQHTVDELGRGGANVLGWLNRYVYERTGDEDEGAGLDPVRARHERRRQARQVRGAERSGRSEKGQAHRRQHVLGGGEPARRHGVGHGARLPGRHRARRARRQSHVHRAHRVLRGAAAGLRAARRRRRHQRHLLGVARERASRPLRAQQVQGARGCRTRPAGTAPRAGASMRSRAAAPGREDGGKCRSELLHVGRLAGHPRPRSERADRHGQRLRRTARAGERRVRDAAPPYPMGVFPKNVDGRIDDERAGWKGPGLFGRLRRRARSFTARAARKAARRW